MRLFHLPPQIVRLVLLTIGIVASYLIARSFLTPPSFGQYGWYRAASLEELASRPPVFAGKKACEECHADVCQKVAKYEHKTVACESCHGVCKPHAEDPDSDKFTPDKRNTTPCVRCHQASPSRPKWLKQIDPAKHYTGQRCAECHIPHQPNEVP